MWPAVLLLLYDLSYVNFFVFFQLVCQETAWTLTSNKALHLQAIHNVENCLNKARLGDKYLSHIHIYFYFFIFQSPD